MLLVDVLQVQRVVRWVQADSHWGLTRAANATFEGQAFHNWSERLVCRGIVDSMIKLSAKLKLTLVATRYGDHGGPNHVLELDEFTLGAP